MQRRVFRPSGGGGGALLAGNAASGIVERSEERVAVCDACRWGGPRLHIKVRSSDVRRRTGRVGERGGIAAAYGQLET